MFTGIATTVPALEHPESVDACCDRGESTPEPMSGPCADAECLCFSCLTVDLAASLPLACPLQGADSAFCSPQAYCPEGFTSAIDYPPETA